MCHGPLVTLVMPVWQPHPVWFRDAIRGALAQTGCDIELVVVDDGNETLVSDDLVDIDDPRLRIVRIRHAGVSAARNAGTAAARGRFIRYVDADDDLPADSTARLLDLADASTIANGATEVCDDSLEAISVLATDIEGDAAEACLLSELDTCHVSMLFPAEVVRAAGDWDPALRVAEDWDFVLRCLEIAPVRSTPAVVTRYRRHATSSTRSVGADDATRHGQRRVIEKYLDRHPERRAVARRAWIVYHSTWARRALDKGRAGVFLEHAVALSRADLRASVPVWRDVTAALVRRGRTVIRALRRAGTDRRR